MGFCTMTLATLLSLTYTTTDMSTWYPFAASNTPEAGDIGLQDWLEKPAGKHGRILRDDDKLIYNGEPIKLWGLNVCYSSCAPKPELSDKRAAFYAKYGINSVRLHKYADGTGWAGIQSEESFLEFDPEALDRMDYFVAQLKKAGIYVLLSSTFHVKLGAADRQCVPYMDEFGELTEKKNRVHTGWGTMFLAPELQNMQIQQIVKILQHRNPYTGLTYAEDPAVAVVELHNEDSALWFGPIRALQRYPTVRKMASERFSKWLKSKYGDHDGLVKAWGAEAIDSFKEEGFEGENLDQDTVVPAGNPWYYDPKQLSGSQAHNRQRLFDTMLFLYEIQNEFYDRYVKAIKETGYDGEILSTNWQAGRAFSHYYNLHSDYRVGLIDRHNYFGGGKDEAFNNATMLSMPGSGSLSSGMQQVSDRPFMLSEWIHVFPNEWGVEGPAIMGTYGMGLQGWDASYMFQNRDSGGYSSKIGRDKWDVTAPQVLGIFPALNRQILRGDVSESEVIATRYVHVPSLHEGKLDFDDQVTQQHDVKTFNSDKVPAETLAVARSVVEFTDDYRDTPAFDLSPYIQDGRLVSSTDQLTWIPGKSKLDGYFTVNTAATKAVVGFAQNQECKLGAITIIPHSYFAAIYVTAQEADKDISTSKKLLIAAIARARNTGMEFNETEDKVLHRGEPPILMEPVKATIRIEKPGRPTVYLLDHDGLRTDKTLDISEGILEIDGANDRTPFYLVQY